MKLSIAVSILLIGSCLAMPQEDDKGFRDTAKDVAKDLAKTFDRREYLAKLKTALGSIIDCQTRCLPPLYYCHTTETFHQVCRYAKLSWFLMIGLPLIIIGGGVGFWYY